jgi:superfamily I DNA/RNA helicase
MKKFGIQVSELIDIESINYLYAVQSSQSVSAQLLDTEEISLRLNKIKKWKEFLNDLQYYGVTGSEKNVLVLAGAGTGKTRVLSYRIAYQILFNNFSEDNILAVTFTKKAAIEIKTRLEKVLNISCKKMLIGTFHSLAHRILCCHFDKVSLSNDFKVMDSNEQLQLIQSLLKSINLINLDSQKLTAVDFQNFINLQKDSGFRSFNVIHQNDSSFLELLKFYKLYEAYSFDIGLVDFSELLIRSYELLSSNPDILNHYVNRIQHIHVDEFQDTSSFQYLFLKLISGAKNNLFLVGDDDQSIYAWRGADIDNILSFPSDNLNYTLVRLEENYRSTFNIIQASNVLISNNSHRIEKSLWTKRKGDLINLHCADTELEEALFVFADIKIYLKKGGLIKDVAILYRSNFQSDTFNDFISNEESIFEDINLMSVHSSKGLEFKVVYLVGCEEGVFPSLKSIDSCIEEERRLFYVAMTRAIDKLTLVYSKSRLQFGDETYPLVSRFINELPVKFLEKLDKDNSSPYFQNRPQFNISFDVGSLISHPNFGRGVILSKAGKGVLESISVLFNDSSLRNLSLSLFKKLENELN